MPSSGKGEVFSGPASEMRDSDWLSVEDMQGIPGAAVELEIIQVLKHKNVQFAKGRSKDVCYSLAFKGASKQLLLNATNQKRLVRMFKGRTADWPGKRVRLHLEDDKLPTGGRGPCTRIVAATEQPKPDQPKTVEQLEAEAADRAAQQKEGK